MLAPRGLRWSQSTIRTGHIRLRCHSNNTRLFSGSSSRGTVGGPHELPDSRKLLWRVTTRPQPFSKTQQSPTSPIRHLSSQNPTTSPQPTSTPLSSTAASPTPSGPPVTPDNPSELPPLESLGDFGVSDLVSTPARIGYLKDLGLDFGWGPTAFIEWLLEHVHVLAGTPWWLSIAITALIVRGALLKFYIDVADTSAKMAALKPVTEPLMQKIRVAQQNKDSMGVSQNTAEMRKIYREMGIKPWKAVVPMVQIFFGYGTFRLMRAMAALPAPGLENGGMLWFKDLTVADPFYILPVTTGLFSLLAMRQGGETGSTLLSPNTMKFFQVALPAITVLIGLNWPAALQFSFSLSVTIGLLQAYAFRTPAFRSFVGIAPLPKTPTPPSSTNKPTSSPHGGKLNVAPTYQPPGTHSTVAPEPATAKTSTKLTGVIGGAINEMRGMGREMVRTAEQYTNASTKPGQKSSAETRRAESYEKRRLREEERKMWESQEAKREKWRMRKESRRTRT